MGKAFGRFLSALLAFAALTACAVEPGSPEYSPYTGTSRSNVQVGGAGGMDGGGGTGGGM